LSQVPRSDVSRDTAEVVILRPRGTYNDFVFDERHRMVRLKGVVRSTDSIAEVGEVRGAWSADGNPFRALVFTLLPTLPGCMLRAHVEGAIEGQTVEGARYALVLNAVGDTETPLKEELASKVLGAAVALLGWRSSTQVRWLEKHAALDLLREGRERLASDRARRRVVRHGAAWRAQPGERGRDGADYADPHSWAERMVSSLPSRFERYVEDELLDEERILFFVERPPFRPPGARWGVLQRRRLPDGLLIVTDRQLLFMVDALPPDATMVNWGYIARTTAVERVQGAGVKAAPDRAVLHVQVQAQSGSEHLAILFPPECKDPLLEVESLLRRFASPEGATVRRLYADEEEAKHKDTVEASSRVGSQVRLEGDELTLRGSKDEVRLNATSISTVEFKHSLVGCRLKFFSPQDRRLVDTSIPFEYPESPQFLAVYRRVRWLLGRPLIAQSTVQEAVTAPAR
jgi:inorganic pyrophosphatase